MSEEGQLVVVPDVSTPSANSECHSHGQSHFITKKSPPGFACPSVMCVGVYSSVCLFFWPGYNQN